MEDKALKKAEITDEEADQAVGGFAPPKIKQKKCIRCGSMFTAIGDVVICPKCMLKDL